MIAPFCSHQKRKFTVHFSFPLGTKHHCSLFVPIRTQNLRSAFCSPWVWNSAVYFTVSPRTKIYHVRFVPIENEILPCTFGFRWDRECTMPFSFPLEAKIHRAKSGTFPAGETEQKYDHGRRSRHNSRVRHIFSRRSWGKIWWDEGKLYLDPSKSYFSDLKLRENLAGRGATWIRAE